VLAVALGALAVLPAAQTAHAADDSVTWTVRTDSNGLGSDRTAYTYTLDPGAETTDAIVIANHGADPVTLRVYAADGGTSTEGSLALVPGDVTSQAVGAWIVPQTDVVTVDGGGTATVPFAVRIPENASPGDYAGGLVTSLTVPDQTEGVNVDRRLGIRVDVRVGGDLTPSLAVEGTSVSWNGGLSLFGGDADVTYTLHNTGNARLGESPAVQVTGPFGVLPIDAPEPGTLPDLLPGESWTQTVTVPGVPALFAVFATATVTPLVVDAAGSRSPIADVSGTAVGAAIPWLLLLLLALVGGLVWGALVLRRRRRRQAQEREDARVDEAVARALALERERDEAASPVQ
jgi:hypothetical protein